MAKARTNVPKLISNRRARHDYQLDDSYVVGLVLSGAETKALRLGHGHLRGAYVALKSGELWLVNATITGFNNVKLSETEQTRDRKLLANKREIAKLEAAKQQGQTIIPLEILTRGRYIKLRIAPGRGKKKYDKREIIKRRDTQRQIERDIKVN